MPRCLVAYYSWTGTTAKVAEAIAQALGADLEPIVEARPRTGAFVYMRTAFQAVTERGSKIVPPAKGAAEYDVVLIGGPVWASNVSAPVRSYLAREAGGLNRVGFFCTMGGMGAKRVWEKMAELAGQKPIATLGLAEADLKSGKWQDAVEAYARDIRAKSAIERADAA